MSSLFAYNPLAFVNAMFSGMVASVKSTGRAVMKGNLAALQTSALAVVVLVIIVAVGAQILGQIRTTQTVNTTEYNVTNKGLDAMKTYGDWFTIIVIIIVAVVIIVLLTRGFGRLAGGV